jgi:valyl-tRNA synthetase
MVMMGLEFAGDIPFREVYVHPVVQARDGRRMSKSLGTGIDPLDEIDVHGADALRFGLLAASSTQDFRFSDERVQQGRDLANKMWNASRLVLLNGGDAEPRPSTATAEDRWINSRLERTIASVTEALDTYDFAHGSLELYSFFYSEFCDWYLEIVKPRLWDGEAEAVGNLLHVLRRVLALVHPVMPFVTEEIWSYLPGAKGQLMTSDFPEADSARFDAGAEAELAAAIDTVREVRRWRELSGVAAGSVLPARASDGAAPHELVARLARLDFDADGGEPLTTIGSVEVLASADVDAGQATERLAERRAQLEGEVKRAEGKLANEGFVAKAPAEVVEAERAKLERYRAELAELG